MRPAKSSANGSSLALTFTFWSIRWLKWALVDAAALPLDLAGRVERAGARAGKLPVDLDDLTNGAADCEWVRFCASERLPILGLDCVLGWAARRNGSKLCLAEADLFLSTGCQFPSSLNGSKSMSVCRNGLKPELVDMPGLEPFELNGLAL
eukprot:1316399-Amorphochlora_amoeboformis.AAC.1